MIRFLCATLLLVSAVPAAQLPEKFDVVIKNGTVYDGTGSEGRKADVAIRGDRIRQYMLKQQTDIKYDIPWNTLVEYLQYLEKRGVSCNIASFIGATTIRENVIGFEDKQPTPQQMDEMRELVRKEMEAGALGIGSALIYPPAFYAKTEELIELCKVAAKYQGKYISHMRSEGNRLLEAFDELLHISREAHIPAELYHI